MKYISSRLVLVVWSLTLTDSFVLLAPQSSCSRSRIRISDFQFMATASDDDGIKSRRMALMTVVQMLLSGTIVSSASASESTIYLTGKSPKVPGEKPKDKSDTKGTRRDPSFLRSISDCKSQCEQKLGPDGYARNKEDCLSECQDVCCTTYEQCTFSITPR